MSNEGKPGTPAPNEITPAPGVPAPHVEAPKPGEKPAGETPKAEGPYASFPTAEAFQERMAREARRIAQESIGLAPEEAKKKLARLDELEKAEEERKKAAMSEIDRAKKEAEDAKKEAEDARKLASSAKAEAEDARAMAKHGVTNEGYARFLLAQERAKTPDGQAFDAPAALAKLLEQPEHAAALKPAAGGEPQKLAADTSSGGNRSEGAAPKPEGKDATDDDYFKRRKAELGI